MAGSVLQMDCGCNKMLFFSERTSFRTQMTTEELFFRFCKRENTEFYLEHEIVGSVHIKRRRLYSSIAIGTLKTLRYTE